MIKVALLGYGTVGSGVAQILLENAAKITSSIGEEVEIAYILDLRQFPDSPLADRFVTDMQIIADDPSVDVVVEMLGGIHPAYDFTMQAIQAGKHVVTSNKAVVGKYGVELLEAAKKNGVRYLFEASVGGGIPVLRPMMCDMAAAHVIGVDGILNGTTNYILTRMKEAGVSFDTALAEAQQKGYAERDPSADVDGADAARKIAILTAVATGILVDPDTVATRGIRTVCEQDTAAAAALGCTVKLIGHAEVNGENGKLQLSVAPCFVPASNPLHGVSDVFNSILVRTDTLGETMFYGKGAGKLPTAGAVVSDILDIAAHPQANFALWRSATAADMDTESRAASYCFVPGNGQNVPANAKKVENIGAYLLTEATEQDLLAITANGGRFYRVLSI